MKPDERVGTVLVLFPGALGDFVCFFPALEELARGRSVDLLARGDYADLLPPRIAARSLERYEVRRLFAPGAELDERLKAFYNAYEAVYSWMGSGQPDFVRHLEILCGGKLKIFPFRPSRSRIHMADYYLSCIGAMPSDNLSTIQPRHDGLLWAERFWEEQGLRDSSVLALAPGSGAKEKNWPLEFYRAVAEWWEKDHGRTVVLLGPVEEERAEIGEEWGSAILVRRLGLAQVAASLSRCALYLGNDSGITHLAAALGVETVALFGPTDPVQWAPRGKKVTLIGQRVECSPCAHPILKRCPHRKCLTGLSPDVVLDVLRNKASGAAATGARFLTRWGAEIKVRFTKNPEEIILP